MPYDYDGSTNEFRRGGGIDSQLQSIIDKVSGSFSGISRGRRAMLEADLGGKAMGIMGSLRQEEMQQAGGLEKVRLGEAGATERANIGIRPGMMEQERKERMRMGPGTFLDPGLGIGEKPPEGPRKPTTWDDMWKRREA